MESSFNQGYLSVYYGCMFAGKTKRLLLKLSKKHDLGLKSCYVTHGDDDRLTEGANLGIGTHWSCFSGSSVPFDCYKTKSLADLRNDLKKYQVIGIDEFQFFTQDNLKTVIDLVEKDRKIVYVVGLDSDFRRHKFGHIFDLIPYCDKSKKIRAKCGRCQKEFHQFNPAISTAKVGGDFSLIREPGSQDKYIPVCRHHYLAHTGNLN